MEDMIKIKYDLGSGEIVNCWAKIVKHSDHYEIFFDDGVSYDSWAAFDSVRRCFYAPD